MINLILRIIFICCNQQVVSWSSTRGMWLSRWTNGKIRKEIGCAFAAIVTCMRSLPLHPEIPVIRLYICQQIIIITIIAVSYINVTINTFLFCGVCDFAPVWPATTPQKQKQSSNGAISPKASKVRPR